MNIYCILIDAVPYSRDIDKIAIDNNLRLLRQSANCFTLTSLSSFMMGRTPSEIEPGGIGWKTHRKYRVHGVNERRDVEVVRWPKIEECVLNVALSEDWDVHVHNGNFFNQIITNDVRYKKTTAYPGGLDSEMNNTWGGQSTIDFIFDDERKAAAYVNEEKKFAREHQVQTSGTDSISFITYYQYHTALAAKKSTQTAMRQIKDILSSWDFDQPDSVFYLFSDHGDFTKYGGRFPNLGLHYTWALLKDNTAHPAEFSTNVVSIDDFYHYALSKMRDMNYDEVVHDENRVFYMEDARASEDMHSSVIASAIRFSSWQNGYPTTADQTIFHRKENAFYSFRHNIVSSTKEVVEKHLLLDDLIKKFGWVTKE